MAVHGGPLGSRGSGEAVHPTVLEAARAWAADDPDPVTAAELDAIITADVVAKTRAALPQATVHTYPAGHGFNRFGHPDWHDESARLAYSRTLEFFERHLR